MYINISTEWNRNNWQRFDITPQDFHRDKRDPTLLIIDSPAIVAAFEPLTRWEIIGKLRLFVPNYTYTCDCDCCCIHYRKRTENPGDYKIGGGEYEIFHCNYTNEELQMLVRLRYPRDAKDEALFHDIITTARYGECASLFKYPTRLLPNCWPTTDTEAI